MITFNSKTMFSKLQIQMKIVKINFNNLRMKKVIMSIIDLVFPPKKVNFIRLKKI